MPIRADAPVAGTATTATLTTAQAPRRRVKDAPTRVAHWAMALAFVVAYVSGDSERWRLVHVTAGYTMLLALALRLAWGLAGPQSIRPRLWWQRARAAATWLARQHQPSVWRDALAHPADWGKKSSTHANALTMLALVLAALALGASGYMVYNDMAAAWVEETHEWLGEAALWGVAVHLAAVAAGSALRRQNRASPMCSGTVPGKGADVVARNRWGLAISMLLVLAGFCAWYWLDAQASLRTEAAAAPTTAATAAASSATCASDATAHSHHGAANIAHNAAPC